MNWCRSSLALTAGAVLSLATTSAALATDGVLILDSSVTGGALSIEAVTAAALPETVTVVNAATWGSMTTAQFAAYQAIVIGDPTCGFLDPVIAATTCTWGPAVNGNVLIIGTDPTFHQSQGGSQLIQSGLAFCAADPTKTGAYLCLSCAYGSALPGTAVPELEGLCLGCPSTCFTASGQLGCYNDSHIVAVSPALTGLTDAMLSNWSCSVHNVFDTWPSDFIPLAIAETAGPALPGGPYEFPDGTFGFPYIMARGDIAPIGDDCVNISNDKVACPEKDSDCYTYTFDITNKSGFDVKYVTLPVNPVGLPGVTLSPNVINLLLQDGSLLEDGETTTISIEICGGKPGDEICFEISLKTPDFVECCFQEICFVLPTCDCGQLLDQEFSEVSCDREGLATFTFCFTLENLSPFDAEHVIFIPFNDEGAVFVKDFFDLPPLVSGGSTPFCVTIEGAEPGEEFCFFVVLEHAGDECCCAFEKCITVPDCPPVDPTGACCFDTGELCLIITAAECESLGGTWLGPDTSCIKCDPIALPGACCVPGAPCFITSFPPDCTAVGGIWLGPFTTCADCPIPNGCEGDLNDDGIVNGIDLAILLGEWTGMGHYKPCPPTISADLDENCHVDGVDLAILLGVWGDCP